MNMICQQLYSDLEKEKDLNITNSQSAEGLRIQLNKQQQKSYQL